MNDTEREVLRRVASTIPESELPCPRLELRWVKLEGAIRYKFRCQYNFVMPITQGDAREGSHVNYGSELRFEMGWTEQDGNLGENFPLDKNGMLYTPFRDGHHVAWDSYATKLPAYVVWDGGAQLLLPRKPVQGPPLKDEPRAENNPTWAVAEYRREMEQAKQALWSFHTRVTALRDQQPEGLVWAYYDAMAADLAKRVTGMGSSFPYDFRDWLAERARHYIGEETGKETVVSCAKCGAVVPKDLREACEHIFTAEERAFLERSPKG